MITLILLATAVSSCYTPGKARRRVIQAQTIHPDIVAALCSQLYPAKDSIHTRVEYLQGETRYLPGELRYVNCDSAANKGNSRVVVPCPPAIYRVDTIRDRTTVHLVDRAKQQVLENDIALLTKRNSKLHATAKLLMYWALAATVAALILLTLLMKTK